MSGGLRFGSSGAIHKGCPITYSVRDDAPDLASFIIGYESSYFDVTFEVEALREFVRLADQALTLMDALRSQGRDKGGQAGARVAVLEPRGPQDRIPTMTHASWMSIDNGCEVTANVSSGEEMFFRLGRLGTWSNCCELAFDVEALRTFATLGAEALAKLNTVHLGDNYAVDLGARQLVTVGR